MIEDRFFEKEDVFREYISMGLDIEVVADSFELDRSEFKTFVNENPYAKQIYLKCKSDFQIQIQKGRIEAIKKGNTTALKMYDDTIDIPSFKIEFIKGDMRDLDEIEQLNRIASYNMDAIIKAGNAGRFDLVDALTGPDFNLTESDKIEVTNEVTGEKK
ncbi:TPA: hypothetical protein JG819_004695 [Vibrio parahaemolyticus]|nr:hypothetical protein [Vibrio parahaemolyticus]HAV1545595.1 hypothetical protein [Vibrio parahaemolyticus]